MRNWARASEGFACVTPCCWRMSAAPEGQQRVEPVGFALLDELELNGLELQSEGVGHGNRYIAGRVQHIFRVADQGVLEQGYALVHRAQCQGPRRLGCRLMVPESTALARQLVPQDIACSAERAW